MSRRAQPEGDPGAKPVCAALLLFYCWTFRDWHGVPWLASGIPAAGRVPAWPFQLLGGPVLASPFWTELYLSVLFLLALGGVLLLLRGSAEAAKAVLAFLLVNKAYFYLADIRLGSDAHRAHLLLSAIFLIGRERRRAVLLGLAACWSLAALARLGAPGGPGAPPALAWPFRQLLGEPGLYLAAPLLLGALLVRGGDAAGQRRDLRAWTALSAAVVAGLWHFALPGDARLTGERGFWAFSMPPLASDRICRLTLEKGPSRLVFEVTWPAASEEEPRYRAEARHGSQPPQELPPGMVVREGPRVLWEPGFFLGFPRELVDPYLAYVTAKRLCAEYRPDRLGVEFLVGAGERPAQVVGLADFCASTPKFVPFWRNAWIQAKAPVTGL